MAVHCSGARCHREKGKQGRTLEKILQRYTFEETRCQQIEGNFLTAGKNDRLHIFSEIFHPLKGTQQGRRKRNG